jgi:hypothetical protein
MRSLAKGMLLGALVDVAALSVPSAVAAQEGQPPTNPSVETEQVDTGERSATEAPGTLPAPEPRVTHTTEWYGWQTLAIDAGATLLLFSAFAVPSRPWDSLAGGMALAGYVAGPPLVHAVHRRLDMALGDAASRVALPVVGFLVGAAIGNATCRAPPNDASAPSAIGSDIGTALCPAGVALEGAAVGAVGAIVLDAALFARTPRTVVGPTDGLVWLPRVSFIPQGMTAGVGAVF